MRIQSREFHKFWLAISAFVVVSFGPLFSLGAMQVTSDPIRLSLSILALRPLSYSELTTRFVSALTGGFLCGWGVTIWCLRCWLYDVAPDATRKCVLYGVLAWFTADSTGSFLAGVYSNVFWNILVLIITVGPLWVAAEEEDSSEASKRPLLQQE